MSKTIVVIGASSPVAKDVCQLLGQTDKVVTMGRTSGDIVCDIRTPFTFPSSIGPIDTVINIAASFGGNEDVEILDAIMTNEVGFLHVCMSAHKAGVKHIVHISSMSAVHQPSSPYYSSYALTKRHGDELAAYYCGLNDIPLTILRPSQLYGDDLGMAHHQPFLYDAVQRAARGEDITIYGSHDPKRNYLHTSDLSETIRRVIDKRVLGTYPCLYPEDTSFREIAATAQSVFARDGSIVFLENKPDIPDNTFDMDLSVYDLIDYRPKVSLEAGIRSIKTKYERGQR